ncbi:YopX family protein [Streptococcus sp. 20-1249]|uniref:YopX family protein n=1 Tax=Streptococcus hepaticus TaxID=3349163 RepID=UPI0037495777
MIPKFRIWNMHENMMVTDDQIIIWNGNVYINEARKLSPKKLTGWSVDDKYLMQSTHLKDKNGVEIFEGDVVKMHSGELLPVKLHHGMFEPVCYYISGVFERVGNIFENPELLKHPDFREVNND